MYRSLGAGDSDLRWAVSVKARCATCGSEHEAPDLSALAKAVSACCSKPKARRRRTKPVIPEREVSLPDLPFSTVFDRLIISQNKTTYSHWSVYKKDHRNWVSRVRFQLAGLSGARLRSSVWHIERQYCPPNRELDYANLVGGAKPLIDCLTEVGVIYDDAPQYFTCTYGQSRAERSQTVLTLLEVPSGL